MNVSYEPRHFTCDPTGEHARTRQAHQAIRDLDRQIAAYKGDDAGLRDLKMAQGNLVRRHGLPPST